MNTGELRIIGRFPTIMAGEVIEGEIKLNWSKDNVEEVTRAEQTFKEYVGKGWLAIGEVMGKEIQIFAFNPDLDKIVLLPLNLGG